MHNICLSPYKNLHILVYVTQPVGVQKKKLRERSDTSVPAGTRHVYENAIPAQKYLPERHYQVLPHHHIPA